jgi:hypothetical protein
MPFLKKLMSVLLMLINWIFQSLLRVLSHCVSAVGGQDDLIDSFANVGYLVLALVASAWECSSWLRRHLLFGNQDQPLHVPQCIIPAQTMAFACASSAASIPMTLKSVQVPELFQVNSQVCCFWERPSTWTERHLLSLRLYLVGRLERNRAQCCALLAGDHHIGSAGTAPVPLLTGLDYHNVWYSWYPDGFLHVVAIDWFLTVASL